MIDYTCPKCKTPMSSPDSMSGQSEACPTCKCTVKVPYSEISNVMQMDPADAGDWPRNTPSVSKASPKKKSSKSSTYIVLAIACIVIITIFVRFIQDDLSKAEIYGGYTANTMKAMDDVKPEDLRSMNDFVLVSKQIRTGLTEGISFNDLNEKAIKLRDAYAIIEKEDLPANFLSSIESTFLSVKDLRETWRAKIEFDAKKITKDEESLVYERVFQNTMQEAEKRLDSFLANYNKVKNK